MSILEQNLTVIFDEQKSRTLALKEKSEFMEKFGESIDSKLQEMKKIQELLDNSIEDDEDENLTTHCQKLFAIPIDEFEIHQSEPTESFEEFKTSLNSIRLKLIPSCVNSSSDEYFRKRYSEEGKPEKPVMIERCGDIFTLSSGVISLKFVTLKFATSMELIVKKLKALGMSSEEIKNIKIIDDVTGDENSDDKTVTDKEILDELTRLTRSDSTVRLEEIKNDPKIEEETKKLAAKLMELKEANKNALSLTIEEYKNIWREYIKETKERKEKEKQRLEEQKRNSEEFYQHQLERYEDDLQRWETDRLKWIPYFLTEDEILNLYQEYRSTPEIVINKIDSSYSYQWLPYQDTITLGLDFARSITKTEKEARCIYEAIIKGSRNEGRNEVLMKYKFNISEYDRITKLFINPPFPLRNSCHEDEHQDEPLIAADMTRNESYHLILSAVSKLEKMSDIEADRRVEILFPIPSGETLYSRVHNVFIEPHPKLASHLSLTKQIEVSCKEVKDAFVGSLYKMDVDRELSPDILNELLSLYKKFDMKNLQVITGLYISNHMLVDIKMKKIRMKITEFKYF